MESTNHSVGSILFVLNSLGRGGSEKKTVQLANGLAARGWSVTVSYLNRPDTLRPEFDAKVSVELLDRAGVFSVAALRRLARLSDRCHADAIVTVNLYPALYAAILRLLGPCRNVGLLASINTYQLSNRTDRWKMIVYGPIFRSFDKLLFGAQEQRRLWCHMYGFSEANSDVLYNGINTERFCGGAVQAAVIEQWPRDRMIVGTVGSLRPEKMHVVLVDAVAELRKRGFDVGLLIVGDGPERTALEGKIRSYRLNDAVHLVGDVIDVRPYLASMDVFALPSVETFSNSALEAMAMSVPVVVTRSGGMPEMLSDGGGRLVEPGDTQELTSALGELLSSKALRIRLGAEAREAAERHFDLQKMIDRFACVASSLSESGRRGA